MRRLRRKKSTSRFTKSSLTDPVRIDLNIVDKPVKLKPELLLHPPIPPALWGINPRNILGKRWWDTVRREVYRRNNYVCAACGVAESRPLHAHEVYVLNTNKHIARFIGVECLCSDCHSFIHFRTLHPNEMLRILNRGVKVLLANNLKVPYLQAYFSGVNVPLDSLEDNYTAQWWLDLQHPEWRLDLRHLGKRLTRKIKPERWLIL